MRNCEASRVFLSAAILLLSGQLAAVQSAAQDPPQTGPQTEQRFPALVVPAGFKATLFACDPLVEYPSVIALGPRPGSVFVAHDYVTGLGVEIVRRDEIRLVEDTNGDGYADKSTLFADGFNSIQGLAQHAGTVYAMHAPLLTALRDTDSDGRADERRDLLNGLGLLPENNSSRLHCANGVVVGHDGWLYLAMGDNGTDVQRLEGDRLILQAGGILRCRPDGRDLHVFSTGLRNIYDIALDEEQNVFVRDNENDGGDYMIRVCHSFYGADHGYPYHYYERPDEALPPLADLGRGSSAGGVCYLETAFPPEFRGNLFFCEWGRAVVRYERQRSGSSFAPMKEFDFATGAPNDPYGFKPTDIIVDHDGSLLVSDWCDGQRPKRGRGRLYRISHVGESPSQAAGAPGSAVSRIQEWIKELDAPSYHRRCAAQVAVQKHGPDGVQIVRSALRDKSMGPLARMHAIWILAQSIGADCIDDLFAVADSDENSAVRGQAVRAIGDLTDPVLVEHRLQAGRGSSSVSERLAGLAKNGAPAIVREVTIALGRLRWSPSPGWLRENLVEPDAALAHAAMHTLRRSDNWSDVLRLLDGEVAEPLRRIALRAVAESYELTVVDGLLERLATETKSHRRQQYADTLSRVYKQPAPWTYWGYRPAPRSANSVEWERSKVIENALDAVLSDPDLDVRAATLKRMQREQVPVRVATLGPWLKVERSPLRVNAILDSLAQAKSDDVSEMLLDIVRTSDHETEIRRRALSLLVSALHPPGDAQRLLELARQVEDGQVTVDLLAELSKRPHVDSREIVLSKVKSSRNEVRAAAIDTAAHLQFKDAAPGLAEFLQNADAQVRRAAAAAAGPLGARQTVDALLALAETDVSEIRCACLVSLRQLKVPAAVAAARGALNDPVTQIAAIDYLAVFGGPEQRDSLVALAASSRSSELLNGVTRTLANWETHHAREPRIRDELAAGIAEVQGRSGVMMRWYVASQLTSDAEAQRLSAGPAETLPSGAILQLGSGADTIAEWQAADAPSLAVSEIAVAEATRAQFLASSNAPLRVWLNGQSVYRRETARAFQPDSDRFEVQLQPSVNRIVVQLGAIPDIARLHVRFRQLSSSADHERITQYMLENSGNSQRGRDVFLNAEKSLCIKCHRLGDQGGNVGPILTGVGNRFSKIHLIESILEPSRTIAPSYETISVTLVSGRVVNGVKVSEDNSLLVMGDDTGKRHEISKSDIEDRTPVRRSTMPDGLEKRLSERELLDLLAYLIAEKARPSP